MTPAELKAWMTEHGYTVRGLASDLGVEYSTVRRWRAGEHRISRATELALSALAD